MFDYKGEFNKTDKLVCLCKIKTSTNDDSSPIKFVKKELDKEFKDTNILPNLFMMKCIHSIDQKTFGIYFTFFIIKIYVYLYIFQRYCYFLFSNK